MSAQDRRRTEADRWVRFFDRSQNRTEGTGVVVLGCEKSILNPAMKAEGMGEDVRASTRAMTDIENEGPHPPKPRKEGLGPG